MKNAHVSMSGVLLTLSSTMLFSLGPPYVKLLAPLTGTEIYAWRIIGILPFVLLLLLITGRGAALLQVARQVCTRPRTALALLACAMIMGVQQWLFLWSPLHGLLLSVSLGYFVLPLVMVLVGRIVDRYAIHPLQWLAVLFALVGVVHEFVVHAVAAWPVLLVALGLPPYFLARRALRHESLVVFALEIAVTQPVVVALACRGAEFSWVIHSPRMLGMLLPGLGLMSTVAFVTYLQASRLLPMGLFGLLGYVEPVLLACFSVLVFREPLDAAELWTYIPIALSVVATGVFVIRATSRGRGSPPAVAVEGT